MKRILSAVLVVCLLGGIGLGLAAAPIKIGICKIVEHPALDAVEQGVIDALTAAGYVQGVDVEYLLASAQGDPGTAVTIAQNYQTRGVSLVVAIATPTAQAAVQVFRGTATPIIYAAVTDPVSAGLVLSATDPSRERERHRRLGHDPGGLPPPALARSRGGDPEGRAWSTIPARRTRSS